MADCPFCRKQNSDGATRCVECSQPLPRSSGRSRAPSGEVPGTGTGGGAFGTGSGSGRVVRPPSGERPARSPTVKFTRDPAWTVTTRSQPPKDEQAPLEPPLVRRAPPPPPGTQTSWLLCDPFPPLALAPGCELSIGRAEDCDLVLPHPSVSRLQALIRVDAAGAVELEDRSSFGTIVNGQRIGRSALRAGDEIGMGAYDLRLVTAPTPGEWNEETRRIRLAKGPVSERTERVEDSYYAKQSPLMQTRDSEAELTVPRPLAPGSPRELVGESGRTYTLLGELGRGGQGVVLLARVEGDASFPGFAKPVDTAVIKMPLAASPAAQDALARERAVYSRPDPGLVNLLDAGQGPSGPFLVLERLHPHPFSRVQGGMALEPGTAIDTFVNLLEVLARLHGRRDLPLVLGDIKPDNVMVRLSNKEGGISAVEYDRRIAGRAWEPVFMDMGCAQDRAALGAIGGRSKDLIGTPIYLPPEAFPRPGERGTFVPGVYSDKTDVYALTLTFYQLLTGDRPYAANGLYEQRGQEFLLTLLDLKRNRQLSPVRPQVLRERFGETHARAFEEVFAVGLAPSPDLRSDARELLKLTRKTFQVYEARVLTLSEYFFDAVHGLHLEQRRFVQGWHK